LLVAIDAATGKVLAKLTGISRRLGQSLYETSAAGLSLVDFAHPTGILWERSIDKVLGSSHYSPNAGWRIGLFGSTYVVTIGRATSSARQDLAESLTVGISASNGKVRWRDPGSFECGESTILAGPYLCLERGTVAITSADANPTLTGGSAVVAGLDPSNGHLTWRFRVGDVYSFVAGTGVALAGTHTLVVPGTHGTPSRLDVLDGTTAPVDAHEAFWCPVLQTFKDTTVSGPATRRAAVDAFSSCSAERRARAAPGGTSPPTAVVAASHAIWVGPRGLEAVPASSSASS
jgi:outer membrane protein assembly factor BamB